MKALVDENLPVRLAGWLRGQGIEAVHVSEVGLRGAADSAIWSWVEAAEALVITRDSDFVERVGASGARVIWITLGNCSNTELMAHLASVWPAVLPRLRAGDRLIEITR